MTMKPASPLRCQSWVRPVTAVRESRRMQSPRPPTWTNPPSGIHTPTYLTISPRSEFGMRGWVNSVLELSSTANSPACPPSWAKSSAPTSSRLALWVSMPVESAMQISSTDSSSASILRRLEDSSGSFHHGSRRISTSRSLTTIAWRIIRLSTRSRIIFSTSRKAFCISLWAS